MIFSVMLRLVSVAFLLSTLCLLHRECSGHASEVPKTSPTLTLGIHLTVQRGADVARLVEELPALAELGINWIILEVNYAYTYRSHPELNAPGDITSAEAENLGAQCKRLRIRLVPQLQSVGHQSWKQHTGRLLTKYPQFDETPGEFPNNAGIYCRSWCPRHPDINPLIFDLFDELIAAFQADAMHVGLDEVFLFASEHCPRCKGADHGDLFAEVINAYHSHLVKKRGVEMLMWGDRLLSRMETGYSHWNADDKGMFRAIDRIPRDIIICDWMYQKLDRYPSIDIFQAKGFRTLSCGWNKVEATEALIDYALRTRTDKYMGHICTVWGTRKPGELATWPPILAAANRIAHLQTVKKEEKEETVQ